MKVVHDDLLKYVMQRALFMRTIKTVEDESEV